MQSLAEIRRNRIYSRFLWLFAVIFSALVVYMTAPWSIVRPLCQTGLPNRTLPLEIWWQLRSLDRDWAACLEFGPKTRYEGVYVATSGLHGTTKFYPYRFVTEAFFAGTSLEGDALGFLNPVPELEAAIERIQRRKYVAEFSVTFEGRPAVEDVSGRFRSQHHFILVERLEKIGLARQPLKEEVERMRRQYNGRGIS